MSETDTQTARSSSRDAHSHRLRRVFSWCLSLDNECSSSPLMGEDRGEGEAFRRSTPSPLTLTLSHQGRGLGHLAAVNGASTHV